MSSSLSRGSSRGSGDRRSKRPRNSPRHQPSYLDGTTCSVMHTMMGTRHLPPPKPPERRRARTAFSSSVFVDQIKAVEGGTRACDRLHTPSTGDRGGSELASQDQESLVNKETAQRQGGGKHSATPSSLHCSVYRRDGVGCRDGPLSAKEDMQEIGAWPPPSRAQKTIRPPGWPGVGRPLRLVHDWRIGKRPFAGGGVRLMDPGPMKASNRLLLEGVVLRRRYNPSSSRAESPVAKHVKAQHPHGVPDDRVRLWSSTTTNTDFTDGLTRLAFVTSTNGRSGGLGSLI